MKKSFLFALALGAIAFNGCKKDEEAPSKKQILTGGNWRVTAATLDGINVLETCTSDNTLYFMEDGTATTNQGTYSCTAADAALSSYSFTNGENTLTWNYSNTTPDVWNVKSSTDNQFVLEETAVNLGVTHTLSVTINKN